MSIESPCPQAEQRDDCDASAAVVAVGVTKRNKLLDSGRTTNNSGAGDEGGGRVQTEGVGGHRWVLSISAVMILLLAACSGSNTESSEPSSTGSTTSSTAAAPTTPTTADETTSTTAKLAGDDAIEAWVQLMEAAAGRVADEESALPVIESVATPEVADQLVDIFVGERPRQITSYVVADLLEDDSVTVEDCLILDDPISTSNSIWLSGHLVPSGSGEWTVDEVTVESLVGCVPNELAQNALDGYENHFQSRADYFDPPNPDSPSLEETTTGRQLELFGGLLADFTRDGHALRSNPELHPEFAAVHSSSEITVIDCQLTDPGRGVYEVETGARTTLIPPIAEGQRDGLQTIMILEDGVWKVEDVQAQRDLECDFAPTELGIPVVPPLDE